MRPSCLDCARKHVAQASILLDEAALGYPEHKWLAVGHLAEAEAETLKVWPKLAETIREHRLGVIDDVPLATLLLIGLLNDAAEDSMQGERVHAGDQDRPTLVSRALGFARRAYSRGSDARIPKGPVH